MWKLLKKKGTKQQDRKRGKREPSQSSSRIEDENSPRRKEENNRYGSIMRDGISRRSNSFVGKKSSEKERDYKISSPSISPVYDAGMERQISAAARKLGEDIQQVVFSAKQGNQAKKKNVNEAGGGDEWKDRLLQVLGGSDEYLKQLQQDEARQDPMRSDIDILLEYTRCDKFVLRCLENELPPNLIHCLRLLRVLELQMAHSYVASNEAEETNEANQDISSASKQATEKVEKLLCALCSDISVGEQLRPHLFGLLALSGATYPSNAVHVARTASNVIVAIAKDCLSRSLAFFLHDRQMIVHMTDDVKELCGMSNTSSGTQASFFLQGKAAELHGLWYFALRAIVYLIREACKNNMFALLNDFSSAGGYHVLYFAITNSDDINMRKILELAVLMISCQTEEAVELGFEDMSLASTSTTNSANDDLCATNPAAFDIIENLMYMSVPFLVDFHQNNHGENLVIEIEDPLKELAKSSIQFSVQSLQTDTSDEMNKDLLSCEILLSTIKLYSDHYLNYTIVEEKHDVLSLFLLSYTTFKSDQIKQLILRMLEYVCTGIEEADYSKPLYVVCEVFFCLCKTLLRLAADEEQLRANQNAIESLTKDTEALCYSLQKLLEVIDTLGEILIDCGILGDLLDEFLALIMTVPICKDGERLESQHGKDIDYCSLYGVVDKTFCAICCLLDLIVKNPVAVSTVTSPRFDRSQNPQNSDLIEKRREDLNSLLRVGITNLGANASKAALCVFESKLTYGDDTALQQDMECIINIFDQLSQTNTKGVNSGHIEDDEKGMIHSRKNDSFTSSINVLRMLKKVLVENKSAQDIFRSKGGFEALIRVIGCVNKYSNGHELGGDIMVLSMVKTVFEVLDASTMPTGREWKDSSLLVTTDVLIKEASTFKSSALANRCYIRENEIYESVLAALAATGAFRVFDMAQSILQLCLSILEPRLQLKSAKAEENANIEEVNNDSMISGDILFLRNPDAIRLLLGSIVLLSQTEPLFSLATEGLNIVLELCAPERAGTTLTQLADTGLCSILTSNAAFMEIFDNIDHPLYYRFVVLLRRIASFKLSYNDFILMLRCIAGPVIKHDNKSQLELPSIFAATGTKELQLDLNQEESKDGSLCLQLQTLISIAEEGDRVPRCLLGDASVPRMHDQTINGNPSTTRFIEIRKIDATAESSISSAATATSMNSNAPERVWAPASTSGFSFSMWLRLKEENEMSTGNLFVFDISSPYTAKSNSALDFISIWYDYISKGFNVITSNWLKPICFPASPLSPGVWHHILLTFQPPKLTNVLSRKTILGLCVDGRPLEVDLKIDSVTLPPNSTLQIGIPNDYLASSGIVDGSLPEWEVGAVILVSTILGPRDAVSIFAAGPDCRSQFWGDRPQRLSLTATASTIFSMLAECGERCSVAAALKRRNIGEIETVSHAIRNSLYDDEKDNEPTMQLSAAGLSCQLVPDCIVCAFHPSTCFVNTEDMCSTSVGQSDQTLLANVAKVNASGNFSTDAIVHGSGCIVSPSCFADNVQWVGGPNILLPIVNAAKTPSTLALSLRVIRESSHRHTPNLEMLQTGGGYRVLAFLLHQKRMMNTIILEHCFAFAIHGFAPKLSHSQPQDKMTDQWVLVDPDGLKYLIMNHQVWNLQSSGPEFLMHLLTLLNGLVDVSAMHNVFNARRLHMMGIIEWTLHLMLEVAELYATGSIGGMVSRRKDFDQKNTGEMLGTVMSSYRNGWSNSSTLSITSTSVGGDPGIPLLSLCKTFLRNVLARMQTPEDLDEIAAAIMYTVSIDTMYEDVASELGFEANKSTQVTMEDDSNLQFGSVTRIYLIRLLEELVVDGMDVITNSTIHTKFANGHNDQNNLAQIASLTSKERKTFMARIRSQSANDDLEKQKEQNMQLFLSIFSSMLTPSWFACVLQGCRDEASASTVFRFLIVMLQSSHSFTSDFQEAGGFTPFVMSIPKYSTSPSVMLSMLSQLLHAPILHLPSFGTLDAEQLCSIFDAESDAKDLILHQQNTGGLRKKSNDPSCGIFALIAECLGRNIQLGAVENNIGLRARQSNEAVLRLLTHRHIFSSPFQDFCASPDFLEPLSQALCLVHSEKILGMEESKNEECITYADITSSNHDTTDYEQSSRQSVISQSSGDFFDNEDAFVDWPTKTFDDSAHSGIESEVQKVRRKGHLTSIHSSVSPTVRFVGGGGDSTGIGLVRLLYHIIAQSVKSGPRAATLIAALFKSFPLHASSTEVEAFHLVLIDQCRSIIEETMHRGSSGSLISFANCVGISSVLLDRLSRGFFSSESCLEATNIILSTLKCVSSEDTYAFRIISKEDPNNHIRFEAAHIARLTTLIAFQRSKPNQWDFGDEILQQKVLQEINSHLDDLLFSSIDISRSAAVAENDLPRDLVESMSLTRSSSSYLLQHYPERDSISDPIRGYITALMSELRSSLFSPNEIICGGAANLIISLLKSNEDIIAQLLSRDIPGPGQTVRHIDLFHGGGFGTLQHQIDESLQSLRLQTFFDWLKVNKSEIYAVFDTICKEAIDLIPIVYGKEIPSPGIAIESEQKEMLLSLTKNDTSNKTILGTFNRSQLTQLLQEKSSESQSLWKRQGFGDLSAGAMKWKSVLLQLKGECSLWEGTFTKVSRKSTEIDNNETMTTCFSNNTDEQLYQPSVSMRQTSHWKLDISEGYERQRKKLLPNYEFDTLYNVFDSAVEEHRNIEGSDSKSGDSVDDSIVTHSSPLDINPDNYVATAELLAKMKFAKSNTDFDENDDYDDFEDETEVDGDLDVDSFKPKFDESDRTGVSPQIQAVSDNDISANNEHENDQINANPDNVNIDGQEALIEDIQDNNYNLITGLLQASDIPEISYNVKRCTGLEVCPALFIRCRDALYIIDGFEQTDEDGLKGNINRVEKATSTYHVNLRSEEFSTDETDNTRDSTGNQEVKKSHEEKKKRTEKLSSSSSSLFQHRCKRIALRDVYIVYRRRYQLKQLALEIYDVHNNGTFIAFGDRRQSEEVLQSILHSPLPNSILNSVAAGSANFDKFMKALRSRITNMWVRGKMSNFDFLMHLNSFAGRSYNDLTQYPVFPWVLADYESEDIDLSNPNIYRDLSKPMGALGVARAEQFKERYDSLESHLLKKDDPPPFHYGTHYSCAAYVLNYLVRMEPFSRLALSLQGGKFDLADRLFNDINASWKSASQDNLQDVRELIPEFYYLPEFLKNSNSFDFGTKQDGKTVHHVKLPPWAKGDPRRFIRINRLVSTIDIAQMQGNELLTFLCF